LAGDVAGGVEGDAEKTAFENKSIGVAIAPKIANTRPFDLGIPMFLSSFLGKIPC
jgi:hypothetical protein